jgi:molecular chaperone HscB
MLDPFLTLGVDARFDLDLAALERRHLELSHTLHPDRFAGRPASERRQALGRAIEVNQAFRRLKDPLGRAEALLERLGVRVEEGSEPKPAPEFLMEMLELREALSAAGQERDAAALGRLGAEVKSREAAALAELSALLASAGPGAAALDAGAVLGRLGELRYYRRFLDEAAALEDDLG